MSATANEINLAGVSGYSSSEEVQSISDFDAAKELAVTNSRVDGLEARLNNFEAGSFSDTTTASFSADFMIGAVDGLGISTGVTDGDEDLQAVYNFNIGLNTSFTGEDSLDIAIDAGNALATGSPLSYSGPLAEFDPETTADGLSVDGVSYTFPVGDKITAIVGDNTDGSALFTTACVYGGPSNTLDDCANVNAGITNGGVAVGASYDFGNGFTAAVGYAGAETGIMTEETTDAYGANVAYTGDAYGVSVTYGIIETSATEENTYTALNGYYSFDNGLNISAGYELGDIGGAANNADESVNYFIGIDGEVGPGTLGAALGTYDGQLENQDEEIMYEAYYSYPVNDGMTITPLVYLKENQKLNPDQTGVMVKTSFSF